MPRKDPDEAQGIDLQGGICPRPSEWDSLAGIIREKTALLAIQPH